MNNKDHFKINIHITVTVQAVPDVSRPVAPAAQRIVRRAVDTDSKVIASAGYDAPHRTLEIEFRSGKVYQYTDVPSYVFDELMDAASIGQYFSYHIRDVYPTHLVAR